MFESLAFYFSLFLKSWRTTPRASGKHLSVQRIAVLMLFWPIFIVIELINALGLGLDYLLFPKFRQITVKEPVFIVGIPRSGTTFLHRLLAQDRRYTTTCFWELLFAPSITQRWFWHLLAKLDKALGAPLAKMLQMLEIHVFGWLDDIHKTGLLAPEEDYLGLIPAGGCFILILLFPEPELWRLAYFDRDLEPKRQKHILDFYHRAIQRHLYFYGENCVYLAKNPSFTPMIQGLHQRFPDAKFIACVRNPSQAVPSQVNSMIVGAKLIDLQVDVDYWREGFIQLLHFYFQHLLSHLPKLSGDKYTFITMESSTADPAAVIKNLYQRFNWHMDADYQSLLDLEAEKAKQYRSQHEYSLEGLSITPERLIEEFDFAYEHFDFERPVR